MSEKQPPVLAVENLTVEFPVGRQYFPAVKGLNLKVEPGEMVALVGESGCGKTATALTAMGLQPETAKITSGQIYFQGKELLGLNEDQWEQYRGKKMSMIFQEPMTALNPLMKVGKQIFEAAITHGMSRQEAKKETLSMMEWVGLPDAKRLYHEYPHRLSGGMRQRVMIALALINRPSLLIADEPTTALDVTIQAQIMELIRRMNRELGTAVLLISHDLGVIRRMCSRVHILYAGQVVESGPVKGVLSRPIHPYTKGLVASIPSPEKRGSRLRPIPGTVSSLSERRGEGCPFYDRCERKQDVCKTKNPPEIRQGDHAARCFDGNREVDG
ncbi:MAG: ABC transporter ATP-binding protein [Acutalibacter sp.]|nr:ABC transporter ATP-binding protein [Acutalibacter sp.]